LKRNDLAQLRNYELKLEELSKTAEKAMKSEKLIETQDLRAKTEKYLRKVKTKMTNYRILKIIAELKVDMKNKLKRFEL